jgi:hypothetical protein
VLTVFNSDEVKIEPKFIERGTYQEKNGIVILDAKDNRFSRGLGSTGFVWHTLLKGSRDLDRLTTT